VEEHGIFSDEGLLEGDFYDAQSAQSRLDAAYQECDAHVSRVCSEHPDHEADSCERCAEELLDEDNETAE